ncbi:hypothetical protein lpari_02756 [Legionella parisiensis]|uniref:Uncharacterized protein n=1 Tax=Legionella parisiensis TaxID=45071 RepID=A0A1E5JPE1_9GAMM|nr:hypothetical protein [Legionella parisiensis]OEH46417.1 hypothetical protein lpari_02756 [Legionella parisiensis]
MKARQENLKQQIQEVKRSLAQDKAPSQKSGLTSVFLESTQMLHIRHAAEHIKRQSNWSDKQEGYNKHLLDEFAKHKKRFTDSAQKMISEGSEKENKKEFETATKQYQEALNILLDCQLHLTEKLGEKRRLKDKNTDERIQFLEKQYETAQEEVESFKKKIEEVSLTLVERHVTSPAKGEVLTLEKVIPQIKSQYKQAYDKAYGESGHGIK